MMSNDEVKFFYTADYKWPKQLNTSLRDEKIIAWLKSLGQPELQNAMHLNDLIPRAKALRWYILLFRDGFVLLGWGEKNFIIQGPSPYTDTSAVERVESTIIAAENAGGIPEKVDSTVLFLFYDFLKAYLRKWGREGVDYFGETTENYYHLY